MKKFFKTLLTLLIILFIVAAAAGGFVISKMNKLTFAEDKVGPDNSYEDMTATDEMRSDLEFTLPTAEKENDKEVLNILLLGTDKALKGTTDPGRADCTILCSVNRATGEIKLISFERGIYVPIPANSNPYGATSDLLTHAYHWGGADLCCSIISECFNVELDGYVQVDFNGVIDIIDAIGGIDLEISAGEAQQINSHVQNDTIHEEGMNHLNGAETLVFARIRKLDSDWQRTGRQRRVIQAAIKQVQMLKISQINTLVDTILPKVHTNLTKADIAALVVSAPQILSDFSVKQLIVPDENMNEYSYIDCNFVYESIKITNFIYGTNYDLPDSGYPKTGSDQ